ncbi:MAG: hypothetical protein NTW05_05445 [Pseudonocardiales bacterium]|nr:hypothetical protein [Pseudonocardiales bacterium]
MTLTDPNAVGAVVLLVVFVVGVLAGRAKGRLGLLLGGLVAVVAVAVVVAGVSGADLSAPPEVLGPRLGDVYAVVLPPAIAFLAGWLAARGTWFRRAVVVGVAVLLLAAFPYAAAGAATAGALTG